MKKIPALLTTVLAISIGASFGFAAPKANKASFSRMDKDGNGSLSSAEFLMARMAAMEKRAENRGESFDAKEMEKRLKKAFSRIDANDDKAISEEEYKAHAGKRKKK